MNRNEIKTIENYFLDQDLPKLYAILRNYRRETKILENIIQRKEIHEEWMKNDKRQ